MSSNSEQNTNGVDRRTVLKTMGGLMASLGFGGFTKIVPHAGATAVPRATLVRCVAVECLGGVEYLALNPMIEELFRPSPKVIHEAVPTVQVNMTKAEEAVMRKFLDTILYGEQHPTKPYRYGKVLGNRAHGRLTKPNDPV